ncbi:hypothetical protein FS837_009965, partial [Tulasnella sp. UAMH 9824]
TLGSGSLISILNTLRYALRSRRAKAPRLFKEAVVGVGGIYILTHAVGLIDLWLHIKSRSISVLRGVPVESEAFYGIAYNETSCGPFNMTGLPCQNLISNQRGGTYWAYDKPWMYLEGFDIISGVSPNLSLEQVGNTAILVPGPSKEFKSKGFSINTQGLHVECANLRDECDRLSSPLAATLTRSSIPVTNCSKAGYPDFPYYTSGELRYSGWDDRNIQSLVLGVIGDEMGGMLRGTADFSSGWTSNPTNTIVQLRWKNATWALITAGNDIDDSNPGATYSNALDLYAKCTMAYLDVIAQYDPIGTEWVIKETSLSQSELASILWTPMIFQLWTDDLRYALMPYITIQPSQAIDTLESLMAKYGMAYAAPLTKFTPASNFTTPQPIALGVYPTAPTLLLVGCLYIYSLAALVIFNLSCTSNNRIVFVPRRLTSKKKKDKEKPVLKLVQSWLTDPLPFIGSTFPGGDGQDTARSVKSDHLQRVYDDLLGSAKVGIGLLEGGNGDMIFGLVRQSRTQKRRHGCAFPYVHEDIIPQEKALIPRSNVIDPSPVVMRKNSIACNQAPGPVSQSLGSELECLPESSQPSSTHQQPQLEIRTSQRRLGIASLVSALSVCAITGGMATLTLGWLCAFRDSDEGSGGVLPVLRNGSFVITESSKSEGSLPSQPQEETLRILMFSAFAGHLVSLPSTILVTLLAYRVAANWLRASDNPNDINLSPLQYGLLVRTLGSGNVVSLYESLRYAIRSSRADAPGFFKEALVSVTGIYLLTYVVSGADLWLHGSARAVSVRRTIPLETEATYGITYSDIKCGPFDENKLPCQKLIETVGDRIYWAWTDLKMHLRLYSAISDVNPYSKLQYINGTAILVPGPGTDYKSRSFTFNTHGIRVQCANLRDQCNRLSAPYAQFLRPGGGPVTNCSKAGYPDFPYYTLGELEASGFDGRNIETLVLGVIGNTMGGMINGTGDFSSSSGRTPNPATTLVQLRWPNVTAHETDETSPGVAYLNALDLYAKCSVAYLDVVAKHDSAEDGWRIAEVNLSSRELASVFWTPLMFQWAGPDVLQALKPYITNRGTQVIENLEMALAKTNMGLISPLMAFIPASNVTTTRQVALGLYPAAPTILLIGCLYIFSLAALVMVFVAYISNSRTIYVPRHLTRDETQDEERSALDVAQTWLTDPLPYIGWLFPGRDGREVARSVESDPLQQAYDNDQEMGKLRIGLYSRGDGEKIFGLINQTPR